MYAMRTYDFHRFTGFIMHISYTIGLGLLRGIRPKRTQKKAIVFVILWLIIFQLFVLFWFHTKTSVTIKTTWSLINRITSKKMNSHLEPPKIRKIIKKSDSRYVFRMHNSSINTNPSDFTIVDSLNNQVHDSTDAKFIVIIPHRVRNTSLGFNILEEKDQRNMKFLAEMLKSIDYLDGATCVQQKICQQMSNHTLLPNKSDNSPWHEIFVNSPCNFARRDWSIQIRNTGSIKELNYTVSSEQELLWDVSRPTRNIVYQLCNIVNGPFVLRRNKSVDKRYINPNLGRLSLLEFFLRSKGKLKIGKFGSCTLSDQLFYSDRGALEGTGDFPEYSNFGARHGILRIIKEDRIEWTKCAASGKLCKEEPYVAPSTLPQVGQPVCCSVVLGKMLKDITDVLVKLGIKHRVVYGTLLGAVRNKAIIPWSHDVDVSLERNNTNNKTFYAILQEYLKDGYYVGKSFMGMSRGIPLMPAHIDVKTTPFFDGESDLQGDIFFSPTITESVQELLPVTRSYWRTRGYMDFYTAPEIWWKDSGIIEINGNSYITVKEIDRELQLWYGKNYLKPALRDNWKGLSDQGSVIG